MEELTTEELTIKEKKSKHIAKVKKNG